MNQASSTPARQGEVDRNEAVRLETRIDPGQTDERPGEQAATMSFTLRNVMLSGASRAATSAP